MIQTERAPAKINLSLDVLRRREDGYHDLRMVMQTVSLYDELSFHPLDEPHFFCSNNLAYLPTGDKNLAARAAKLYYEAAGLPGGLKISIRKTIPVGAGLGGGSSDAAAVLRWLNRNGHLSDQRLHELALQCGSDVPFCLHGGTQLAEGRGEILTVLPALPPCTVLLCKPQVSISTAAVFGSFSLFRKRQRPDTDGILRSLREGSAPALARRMYNVLEDGVAAKHRDITIIHKLLIELGALGAVMSGSGPTVFGLFPDKQSAQPAYKALKSRYPETWFATSEVNI